MKALIDWKNSPNRMPLLVDGARQVGKTWLLKEFGRLHFEKCAYINLENNAVMQQVFEEYTDTDRLIRALSAFARVQIDPVNTLIILDEIQEIPFALSSLKYFSEQSPEYAVAAAGSLLGVKFPKRQAPFPVGKINSLKLYPLSFTEFLLAVGQEQLLKTLQTRDFQVISSLSPTFEKHLSDYYFVGGMPQVVSTFIKTSDYHQARAVQIQLIDDLENDMSKHLSTTVASRTHALWQSVPIQLGREQGKRFFFSEVQGSKRARDFKDALQWLTDAKLVTKVLRISKPGIPLKAYASEDLFEVYLLDIGLFSAMIDLDIESILTISPLFQEGRGALSEQFVCQQLLAELGATPFYWASDTTPAQLDFVVSHNGKIFPIEVKARENLKAKSLRVFCERYDMNGYRLSLAGYKDQGWMKNIPLFAVSLLFSD